MTGVDNFLEIIKKNEEFYNISFKFTDNCITTPKDLDKNLNQKETALCEYDSEYKNEHPVYTTFILDKNGIVEKKQEVDVKTNERIGEKQKKQYTLEEFKVVSEKGLFDSF